MGLLNLRNALMAGKRLPYDAEVEYLARTNGGGQYINTGYIPKSNSGVQVSFRLSYVSANDAVFGSRTSGANDRFWIVPSSNGLNYGFGSSYTLPVPSANTDYTAQLNFGASGTASYGSNSVNISGFGGCPFPLYLFAANVSGTASFMSYGKRIYGCKITEGSEVVADFIPVRKGTVGYLYDRVSGKLFGNAGTGDFVVGSDVVPVEWLSSDGAAYINTGVIPADDIGARATFTVSARGTYVDNYVLGSRAVGEARFYLYNNEGSSFVKYGWGSMITTSSPVVLNQKITASLNYCNDRKFVFNGYEVQSALPTTDFSANVYPMFLFYTNFAGQQITSAILHGSIYDCEITKGATPVLSFLPVRVGTGSTWEGAMMDTLTRRIYRNAGTGAFSYGNDLKYPIPA